MPDVIIAGLSERVVDRLAVRAVGAVAPMPLPCVRGVQCQVFAGYRFPDVERGWGAGEVGDDRDERGGCG